MSSVVIFEGVQNFLKLQVNKEIQLEVKNPVMETNEAGIAAFNRNKEDVECPLDPSPRPRSNVEN